MKILWLDINSSYSHSSVALPAIHAQVQDRKEWEWCVVRGTINDNPGTIAAAVADQKPDVIAATFWLFTHQMQLEVLARAVQLVSGVKIVCGGPEFLGENEAFLRSHSFITAVIRGEGERALPEFLTVMEDSPNWEKVEGLCWIGSEDGCYHDNGTARVADFASLRYPEESTFFNWDKPFVQLETTRGCFNTCAFCVSGGEKPVRYQSISQVAARLENICAHGIKDIRVLDRTFNYDIDRACEMLDLFMKYEGKMRFHLEIHPSLISGALMEKLSGMPEGILHLEAGIQSLDSKVLEESGRRGSLDSSLKGLEYLCSSSNLQTHADLIAGLPEYTLEMLHSDIARLVAMGVDELQIESLKVLPGTRMRSEAREKGLKFSPMPPYEILQTPVMSPGEIRKAMQISRMIDLYYNSTAWQKVTRKMICDHQGFAEEFTGHLHEMMVLNSPVSLERRGIILYQYCKTHHPEMVTDITIAWIQAGFSLMKEPAGKSVKIKHLDTFLKENNLDMSVEYGQASPSHRYYLLTSSDRRILFGYDSENHQPAPVFMAYLAPIL